MKNEKVHGNGANNEVLGKLQNLLKQLFEIDASSDLDFGIYRILNFRRREINKFIEERLPQRVNEAFAHFAAHTEEEINRRMAELRRKIRENFGEQAVDANGTLKQEFRNTPLGQEYEQLSKQQADAVAVEDMKTRVYNDLYTFFSRYYEDGDFVPRYRYSIRGHKYAIPYNGEEIKLYWVNSGQYYTKTGTLFRDYTFVAGNTRIVFRLSEATEELGSNKATNDRFFVLDSEEPIVFETGPKGEDGKSRTVVVRFNYRELYEGDAWFQHIQGLSAKPSNASSNNESSGKVEEVESWEEENYDEDEGTQLGSGTARTTVRIKQDNLNTLLEEAIIDAVAKEDKMLADWLAEPVQRNAGPDRRQEGDQQQNRSLLGYHLRRFTSKNNRDYFIHKNLRAFLNDQLDYFIKAEVLDTSTLLEPNEVNKHLSRAGAVKELGTAIIDFLAQVEDFQKRLWEKKKFVIKTDYVITLNRLAQWTNPEFMKFVEEAVLGNQEQLSEWNTMLALNPETTRWTRESLLRGGGANDGELWSAGVGSDAFRPEMYKPLPLDTAYFDSEFKWRVLAEISKSVGLDDALDGLLVKSENFQALNTLLGKYKAKVQTIYIDPPFNKEQDADFLYNVKYKDSTWASMLENRLRLGREMLSERGSIFVRCDYNGNWIVRPIMDDIFGRENFRNEIIVKRGSPKAGLFEQFGELKSIGVMYDNLYLYSKIPETGWKGFIKILSDKREGYWTSFKKIYDRPTMRYEIEGITLEKGQWMWNKERTYQAIENYKEYLKVSEKTGERLEDYSNRTGISEFVRRHKNSIQYWVKPKESVLLDNNWLDIPGYSSTTNFKTENSEILLKRVIESTSNQGDLVMDFFLGSGTTTAVAHKLGRKWIGVEMGEHFWTVVLPRMKKVLAYDKSGISKEQDVKEIYNEKTAGGFFKYQILEQYEDVLDNLELSPNDNYLSLFQDEYLLKYFLTEESKNSPYLLQIEQLSKPFSYKLKVNLKEVGDPQELVIDLPETFNYLLGLNVKCMVMKTMGGDGEAVSEIGDAVATPLIGNKYLFVLGLEQESQQKVAVIWRDWHSKSWKKTDYDADKTFIVESLKEITGENLTLKTVYVNGQSTLTHSDVSGAVVMAIEPEFKRLMEPTGVSLP
ncbi:site-specific DNA-methyltransferase [Coprothermobacter proteolyticus]|uniref:site-specific DNA-methyltransferase n=1 Tax=Coprothermobacter proteolyticus TaxID=35786 RepID=UPI000D311461|nr:site-specific DNA-methyltransferase [Coprothermobacter proteolyticus]